MFKLFKKKQSVIEKKLNLLVGLVVIVIAVLGVIAARNPQLFSAWMTTGKTYQAATTQYQSAAEAVTETTNTGTELVLEPKYAGDWCRREWGNGNWDPSDFYVRKFVNNNLDDLTVSCVLKDQNGNMITGNSFSSILEINDPDVVGKKIKKFSWSPTSTTSATVKVQCGDLVSNTMELESYAHGDYVGTTQNGVYINGSAIVSLPTAGASVTKEYSARISGSGTGGFSGDRVPELKLNGQPYYPTFESKWVASAWAENFSHTFTGPGTHTFDIKFYCMKNFLTVSVIVDRDGDRIADSNDNCPDDPNNNQADMDNDNIGDVCDNDKDGDGVNNNVDVFPEDSSESLDTDSDGIGNNADICPNAYNPGQEDDNNTGFGDACEPDTDGDGVEDWEDNCVDVPNADQADSDSDGVGDACTDVTISGCTGPAYGAGYRVISADGGDGDIIWSYTGGTGSESGNRNKTLTLVYPNADASYTVTACDQLGQCASCDIPINERVGIANCPEEILGYDDETEALIPVRPNIRFEAIGGTAYDWTLSAFDGSEQSFSGDSVFLQDLPLGEYDMSVIEPDNDFNRDNCDFDVVPYNIADASKVLNILKEIKKGIQPSVEDILLYDANLNSVIDLSDAAYILANFE